MGIFLAAEWRDIAVLTYTIDPSVLQPYLFGGLYLDKWQGEALASLVGFRFLNTRVFGCHMPFWGSFPEVNLRFYVCRDTAQGPRRGVVFIKEIVPYYPVAAIARAGYNENYHHLPMSWEVSAGRAEYRWQFAGRENHLAIASDDPPTTPAGDSLDTFIVEHHWGYSRTRGGRTLEYEVDRPSWRTYSISRFEADVDVANNYGSQCAAALSRPPISVVLAEGSQITVSLPNKLGSVNCPRAGAAA